MRFISLVLLAIAVSHGASETQAAERPRNLTLAASWQPAFCETESSRRECVSQTEDRFDATNFSLHGLWLDRRNCPGIRYSRLPQNLWEELRVVMPGTRSGLQRHEWEKHGRCYSSEPATYYRDSLKLMAALNASPVRALFERRKGAFLSAQEIRRTFDNAFGRGAGDRVEIKCVQDGRRLLIEELRIAMKGDPKAQGFGVLIRQARARKQGCRGGIVDRVGLQ
ncbi:MAG: ribonuclease [Pseudomonadota bacterium]